MHKEPLYTMLFNLWVDNGMPKKNGFSKICKLTAVGILAVYGEEDVNDELKRRR